MMIETWAKAAAMVASRTEDFVIVSLKKIKKESFEEKYNESFMLYKISLDKPEFHKSEKVHDWRNYVGNNIIALWDTFTTEQRAAIALEAQTRASNEDWD
jgi:hypothetical protein